MDEYDYKADIKNWEAKHGNVKYSKELVEELNIKEHHNKIDEQK